MSSLDHNEQMSITTARDIVWVFAKTYRMDTAGDFVNKIGEPAPERTIDLVLEAQGILADAE